MNSIFALLIAIILAIPTVACAWDEDGKFFEQELIEAEAEAKLANYYDPALEESKESDITMRTCCIDGYKFLLTVDEASGNLNVLQMIGSEGFPLECSIK